MSWIDVFRRIAPAASALVLAAFLSACATGDRNAARAEKLAPTPTEQFKIHVDEARDGISLEPHLDGLSPAQRAALVALVDRWRTSPGAGDFAVQPPSTGDRAAADRTASDVVAALRILGVPAQRIDNADYAAPAGGPVLVSYPRLEAHTHDCAGTWDDLSATDANRPSAHFGCTVTANFAAQVADPRDFLNPATTTPADAQRRENVLGKYRTGDVTSTTADAQANGTVSKAVAP